MCSPSDAPATIDSIASTKSIEELSVHEIYATLATGTRGLSHAEAKSRLERSGPNVIHEVKGKPLLLKLLANFTHLMAILLWVGGTVALIAGMPELAIAIWMVNVINGAFSFRQEYKAEKATEAMRRLLPVHAGVVRDGNMVLIPASELVPGDVLVLSEGDRISADARLVEESELRVDQSTLSGESQQVRKTRDAIPARGLARVEIPNLVFAGTTVASGSGRAVVFATGMETEFGKIARFAQSVGDEESPLQKEMRRITRVVTVIASSVGVVIFMLAVFLAGVNLAESFILAMGMIVAFVPEGLLPTVTLSLAMGVQRMARRNALIKRLSAVETLGSTSVICTDKTGTLTQNEMTVREIRLPGGGYAVTGVGYEPDGRIEAAGGARPPSPASRDDLTLLLTAAALCNNARILPPNTPGTKSEQGESGKSGRWTVIGDPTEAALRVVAMKGGLDLAAAEKRTPRLRELPFESRRKRMSTIHAAGDSRTVFVKGAPREVVALCTSFRMDGRDHAMDDAKRTGVMDANDAAARSGLRVLAVAMRDLPPSPVQQGSGRSAEYTAETIEKELTFLGLVAMMDPPRKEVSDAVDKCHHAGIRIIMITGDYGLTAESIARRIGIVRGDRPRVITGADLDGMSSEDLKEALRDEVIFARVAPEHKMQVVIALQETGHIVAVTGDGVNDAPALKRADIGVAMGISGTDVAREAADMILTDDNFASIVNAIEEGRAVYANIKKFTTLIFTCNATEAIPFILFAFSRARIPLALTVMQILSIDLGADIVPALALGAEPPERGVMDRPPRDRDEHVITRRLLIRAFLWLGPIQGLAVMAAFYFQYWTNGYEGRLLDLPSQGYLYESATAMTLAAVVVTQIGNVFAQRTDRISVFRIGMFTNPLIWGGVATSLVFVSLVIYVPFLQHVFGTQPFELKNWLFLLALSPLLLVADELRKALARRRERRKAGDGKGDGS